MSHAVNAIFIFNNPSLSDINETHKNKANIPNLCGQNSD
ncbi:hypothetical protein MTBBW1_760057 [Desulfamplus magnetovallimortis]|uniref:Uncharacterized protein n=1 Tax=Desulfamplus magnetovallimortis TaxID=1246637 RepID=A0A1W1HJG8_9BACT|nr:hypothetical protein MTBBW1_760057 [Desulfamplus magnetovallimortis]